MATANGDKTTVEHDSGGFAFFRSSELALGVWTRTSARILGDGWAPIPLYVRIGIGLVWIVVLHRSQATALSCRARFRQNCNRRAPDGDDLRCISGSSESPRPWSARASDLSPAPRSPPVRRAIPAPFAASPTLSTFPSTTRLAFGTCDVPRFVGGSIFQGSGIAAPWLRINSLPRDAHGILPVVDVFSKRRVVNCANFSP